MLATVKLLVIAVAIELLVAANGATLTLAPARGENGKSGWVHDVKATKAMSRCMATWGPSTQMSKQEWRATCKRVVKRHPGLYNKPF
jgi:hypothetical protein